MEKNMSHGVTMQRIIYVSESRIEKTESQYAVAAIVEHAQVKNAQLGITGALLYTGGHFAQVLEGTPEAIYMLMAFIYNDPRHGNVVVVDKSSISHRRFHDWQMAYQGPSQFVSRHVTKLLHATSPFQQRRAAEWIMDLAYEFSVPLNLPRYMKLVSSRPSH